MQYAEYAQKQRERLAGEGLERYLTFWRRHLAGRPQLLELPTNRLRPSAQTFQGSEVVISLPKGLSYGIQSLSRQQKTTPYTVLLTAFNLLLARYTGSQDIVIGSPTANRNEVGIQALIGFFVNVIPLRTAWSGNPTFLELLGQVRATLIETMSEWSGAAVTLVDLEGHGREAFGDVVLDTSRTVGWFTSMYPVLLSVEAGMGTAERVTAVQERLAQIPGKGLGYGLLRYLRPYREAGDKLGALPQAEISFNYLGQYDNLLPSDSPFRLSSDPVGPTRNPCSERKHLLNINARVRNGRLEISWTFSQNHHRPATIARLTERYVNHLQRLIGERPINGVLRPVYEAIQRSAVGGKVEAVYTLAPGQSAMLVHTRTHSDTVAYFLQWVYGFEGTLDSAAFRRAWMLVVERHQILRTRFETADNGDIFQVVLRDVSQQPAGMDGARKIGGGCRRRNRWRGWRSCWRQTGGGDFGRLPSRRFAGFWCGLGSDLTGWSGATTTRCWMAGRWRYCGGKCWRLMKRLGGAGGRNCQWLLGTAVIWNGSGGSRYLRRGVIGGGGC